MNEVFISVDVEASGPSPGAGSLIAIGACPVYKPNVGFYTELQPVEGMPWDEGAERVHQLSRERLSGAPTPAEAMAEFARWLKSYCGPMGRPIFVGFNATFDWMFTCDYFHRFYGSNPFGISGLDLKAYYMGKHNILDWRDTAKKRIRLRPEYRSNMRHTHNALDDAREQAQLCRELMK